jgi:hypothetical protein
MLEIDLEFVHIAFTIIKEALIDYSGVESILLPSFIAL